MEVESEGLLGPFLEIFHHIRNVQREVCAMSERSATAFHRHLEENAMEMTESLLEALQGQDIVSQQFTAIDELIDTVEKTLAGNDPAWVCAGLKRALERARKKREAYGGNAMNAQKCDVHFF